MLVVPANMEKAKLPCTMGAACDYQTPELEFEQAVKLLDRHLLGAHEQGTANGQAVKSQAKTGKIIRPRLELKDSYVEEEQFAFF